MFAGVAMFHVLLWPLTGDADGAAARVALPAHLHRGWGEAPDVVFAPRLSSLLPLVVLKLSPSPR